MTVNILPTTSATPITTITQSSSGGSTASIADLASEFSSLLANFASTQSNSSTSSAQTASGTSAAQSSSGSSAAQTATSSQTSNLAPGVEAFLFVSQTTTNAAPAAPAQSSQPPLFASIDTDGNGLINQQEFVNKFGASGNQAAASQLFNVLDKNADGEIDGTELASSNLNAPTDSSQTTGAQAPSGSSASWSPSSLFQLLPGMQASSIPGSPNLPLFTRLDSNGDGLVSEPEFASAYGSNSAQAASAFAAIDTNNTGSITWSQLDAVQSALTSGSSTSTPGTTTTTTTFFAELIPLQSTPNASSTPSSSTSTTVPSGSSTASSTGATTPAGGTTTPTPGSTTPDTITPAATTTTPDTTTPAAATTTPASATTATTPSTSTLASEAAAALSNTSTAAQASSSQATASLDANLLNSLTPNTTNNPNTSNNNG
jgi:Ca2+-binding EF-hand superfamily protein